VRIKVKSCPEFFEKEKSGLKPNTVRKLDGLDLIEIENTEGKESFVRTIRDISVFDGRVIISFGKKTGELK